jgi:opacity protein-like surface antigen
MRSKMSLMLSVAMILLGGTAMAQDQVPKLELFGGFSYIRTAGHSNINGWNAQAAVNVNKWIGFAADFAGHYQTESMDATRSSASLTSFMFGPQLSDRAGRVTGFAHALFGGAHAGEGLLIGHGPLASSATNFSMAFGGGVDANVNDSIAVRLFQADYLMVRANNPVSNQSEARNNFRLSVGVVFKIK